MPNNETSFDGDLDRLEAIVQKLESGGLSLDDAIKYYADGIALEAILRQKLQVAYSKIDAIKRGGSKSPLADPKDGVSED